MLHASSFDAANQRLFVTLALTASTSAIGVIDLAATGGPSMRVVAEGSTPDLHDTLVSLHWDRESSKLLGIVLMGADLQLHALDPAAEAWDAEKELQAVPSYWNTVGGNEATVSAFSPETRTLYLMAGQQNGGGPGTPMQMELAAINVDDAAVVAHPALAPAGMPGCTTCIMGFAL